MNEKIENYIKEVSIPLGDIFNDMLKYAPSKLFALFGNAIIVPVYTNLLSPSQYGVYAIALAVLSFLCIIFSDWIGLAALRFFRKNQLEEKIPQYMTTLIMMLGVNLFALYLLAFVFRHQFYNYFGISPKIFLFVLILILPVAIRALSFQVLRAQIKPGAFTVSTIINQLLTVVVAVLLLKYTNLQAMSILAAMAVSITIIDVILIHQCSLIKFFEFKKPDIAMSKSIALYGLPLATASLSMWVINQSNKFITNYYHGLNDAGLVGVAYNMTFPILMTFFAIITVASYPRIINLFEEKVDVRPLLSRLTGYFLVVSVPIVVFMSIYASDLITLFANSKYQNAYILIPYFALSAMFLSFSEYTTMQYHLANKTYIMIFQKVFGGLLGLVLNFILIKKYGLLGVGVATLVSNAAYFIFSLFIKMPNLEWQVPFKVILRILLSFIPTAGLYCVFVAAQVNEVIQMPLILLFYYLVFYYFKKYFKEPVFEK